MLKHKALLSICTFTAVCAVAHAEPLDVFTCDAGSIKAVRVSIPDNDSARLIRNGSALWASGAIDANAVNAMVESRGIWGIVPTAKVFEALKTQTHPSYLAAIANVESGRGGRPWPWTINFNGRGYFFKSMSEAVEAARYLIGNGYTSFDVGFMQVNWHFHGSRFPSLEAAFDPVQNIRVADAFVQENYRQTGSMAEAVGRYHSKTPTLKHNYLQRVNHHLRGSFQPSLSRINPC